jgi:hypothetical protein
VHEDSYIPLADVAVPCSVRRIREEAVELLANEERVVERQLVYTLAQERVVACTAFAHALAEGDAAVLRSTVPEGYRLLREYLLLRGSARRRGLAAKAGAACRALLRLNFAFRPARLGRAHLAASTAQARLLLAYLPLEPLRSTALGRPAAEAVVDFAIGLRQAAVSAYLRGATPGDVLRMLTSYVRDASKELEEVARFATLVGDHLYDEVVYTRYYLRYWGLL